MGMLVHTDSSEWWGQELVAAGHQQQEGMQFMVTPDKQLCAAPQS